MKLVFKSFRNMLDLLSSVERHKVFNLILSQWMISALDVIAIGLLSSILLSNQSIKIGPIFSAFSPEQVKLISITLVVILFTLKGFLSYLNYVRLYLFLETLAISKSFQNFKAIDQNEEIKGGKFDSTDVAYAVTVGSVARYLDLFGSSIILINEVAYLVAILVTLFIFQPIISITAIVVFGSIMAGLHKITRNITQGMGEVRGISEKNGIQLVQQFIISRREIFVYQLQPQFFESFLRERSKGIKASSKIQIAYLLPKYIFESGLMISGLTVLILNLYILKNPIAESIATLSIFLGAAARLTPSVLRIQFYKNFAANSLGLAKTSISIFKDSPTQDSNNKSSVEIKTLPENSNILVRFNDIDFSYPDSPKSTLSKINFEIHRNSFNCLIGVSGSGKSTLLDILLGLRNQNSGHIEFSQSLVQDGKLNLQNIGYVPQKISIFENTILYNILLKENATIEEIFRVSEILEEVQLTEFINELPLGTSTLLTENAGNLSGGQLQRIGIARALIRGPKLLILDEATNAIDSQTEKIILQNMLRKRELTSVLLVTHSNRNTMFADQVLELRNSSILID